MQIEEIVCKGEKSDINFSDYHLPYTEIPRWLNSKHQSVGNSKVVEFRVGRKFPNVFAVYFAFGLMWDDPIYLYVYISINGFEKVQISNFRLHDVSDILWVFSRSNLKLQKLLNESNPSDYNHVEVTYEWGEVIDDEVTDDEVIDRNDPPYEIRRWGVKVECICCPQKSSVSSSMALTLDDNDSDSNLNLPLKKRRKY